MVIQVFIEDNLKERKTLMAIQVFIEDNLKERRTLMAIHCTLPVRKDARGMKTEID